MAGHSAFKNIMHRKDAQDGRRARLFNKLAREITVAARTGFPEPQANPRLRSAILAARAHNMPRERIERAVKGRGGEQYQYEEVHYEGYGPAKVALMVETLTDNRRRTVAELRTLFGKHGGSLEANGAVRFRFERVGTIIYACEGDEGERIFETALEAGAEDIRFEAGECEILTEPNELARLREIMEIGYGSPLQARLGWRALDHVALQPDDARRLLELMRVLDDHEDVQYVSGNFTFDQEFIDNFVS